MNQLTKCLEQVKFAAFSTAIILFHLSIVIAIAQVNRVARTVCSLIVTFIPKNKELLQRIAVLKCNIILFFTGSILFLSQAVMLAIMQIKNVFD